MTKIIRAEKTHRDARTMTYLNQETYPRNRCAHPGAWTTGNYLFGERLDEFLGFFIEARDQLPNHPVGNAAETIELRFQGDDHFILLLEQDSTAEFCIGI